MELAFLASIFSPFLNKSFSFAILHPERKEAWLIDSFLILEKCISMPGAPSFRNLAAIWSIPIATETSRLVNILFVVLTGTLWNVKFSNPSQKLLEYSLVDSVLNFLFLRRSFWVTESARFKENCLKIFAFSLVLKQTIPLCFNVIFDYLFLKVIQEASWCSKVF